MNWKYKLLILGAVAGGIALWWLLQLPCPWYALTGIPCPGCGMTRAVLAALQLDFITAFRMHSMVWSIPVLIAFFWKDGKIFSKKWLNISLICVIFAGFFVNWIVRLL